MEEAIAMELFNEVKHQLNTKLVGYTHRNQILSDLLNSSLFKSSDIMIIDMMLQNRNIDNIKHILLYTTSGITEKLMYINETIKCFEPKLNKTISL